MSTEVESTLHELDRLRDLMQRADGTQSDEQAQACQAIIRARQALSSHFATPRMVQSQSDYELGGVRETPHAKRQTHQPQQGTGAITHRVDMRSCAERFGPVPPAPAALKSLTQFARLMVNNVDLTPMMGPSGANETVPSEGGWLVPPQFAYELLDASFEKSIVQPRCRFEKMTSPQKIISVFDDQSHAQNIRFGGLTMNFLTEGDEANFQLPKLRQISLNAKLAVMLVPSTNQLLTDAPEYANSLPAVMVEAYSWNIDRLCLVDGVGAGQPLSVVNCPSAIGINRTTTGSIVWEDLVTMFSRLHASSFANAVWVAHQSTLPKLLQLSVAVGTAGSWVPVLNESNGTYSILGRPVIFTEKVNQLGTKADIMLADLSQYMLGVMVDNFRLDNSSHLLFKSYETVFRLVSRMDAQSLWSQPFQPKGGAPTQSWALYLNA